MSSVESKSNLILLICGYLRQNENELKLYMNIPTGIVTIMQKLYPVFIFKFGDFKNGAFAVSKERTIIKGSSSNKMDPNTWEMPGCHGYFVYADLGQFNDMGLNNGIHVWSVKMLHRVNYGAECFASIGVTTEKNDKLINEWNHDGNCGIHWNPKAVNDESISSFYQGCNKWNFEEIVTVRLNCNDWKVTYYVDKKILKTDRIKPERSYYFAMLLCGLERYTYFEVVESDLEYITIN